MKIINFHFNKPFKNVPLLSTYAFVGIVKFIVRFLICFAIRENILLNFYVP